MKYVEKNEFRHVFKWYSKYKMIKRSYKKSFDFILQDNHRKIIYIKSLGFVFESAQKKYIYYV